MNRRDFLTYTASGIAAPHLLSNTASAATERSLDSLWQHNFKKSDYAVVTELLLDYEKGLEKADKTEDQVVIETSETTVEVGRPIGQIYNAATPDEVESLINYGPRIASTDVNLLFSLLEEVERILDVDLPWGRIAEASNRAFLLKSLLAATINFYRACEDVVEASKLTFELRKNFYISLVVLLIECVLGYYPFNYKIAWRGTRFIHNQFLVRARSILGNRGIAVIMKVIHWSVIRGSLQMAYTPDSIDSLVQFVTHHGQEIYDRLVQTLRSVGEDYSLDRLETYGFETLTDIPASVSKFITDDLLDPLMDVLTTLKGKTKEQLEYDILGSLEVGDVEIGWKQAVANELARNVGTS